MKILYLHGLKSQPGGVKATLLRGKGHEVAMPALPDKDFDASVRLAQQTYDELHPDVVVGSSRGGAVAMAIDSQETPLVLISPDWKKWGNKTTTKAATVILHSAADDAIALEDSRTLLQNSGLPKTALRAVGTSHFMVDEAALQALVDAVEQFGEDRPAP